MVPPIFYRLHLCNCVPPCATTMPRALHHVQQTWWLLHTHQTAVFPCWISNVDHVDDLVSLLKYLALSITLLRLIDEHVCMRKRAGTREDIFNQLGMPLH